MRPEKEGQAAALPKKQTQDAGLKASATWKKNKHGGLGVTRARFLRGMLATSPSYREREGSLGCEGGLSGLGEEPPMVSSACDKLLGSVESPARVVCEC